MGNYNFGSAGPYWNGQSMLGAMGVGNVYHVVNNKDTAFAAEMVKKFKGSRYQDGSHVLYVHDALNTTITYNALQAALDATLACRNDYVVVWPSGSDYDIAAALTMSKKSVHFVCPAGIGAGITANAVRIHQNTAATDCIISTADSIEIAGFFFKGMADSPIITLSSTRWHNTIASNFFGGATTAGGAIYTIGATGAVYQCSIIDNYIMGGYSPTPAQTISGLVGFTSASSGRNLIKGNQFVTGAGTTCTAGLRLAGDNDLVVGNYFVETIAGVLTVGVFTKCWNTAANTHFSDNRVSMATPDGDGGTAHRTHTENWSSTGGSAIIEAS